MPYPGFRDGDAARRQADQARERARLEAERARQEQLRHSQEQRERERQQEEAARAASLRAQLSRQEAARAANLHAQLSRQEADRQRQTLETQRREQERLRQREAELRQQQLDAQTRRQRALASPGVNFPGFFRSLFGRRPPAGTSSRRSAGTPTTRAEAAVVAQEAQVNGAAAEDIRDALSNAKRIGKFLPYLSEEARDGLPLDLLLGWIDKESSGQLNSEEATRQTGNPNYNLDEIGPFQISVEERHLYLKLRHSDRVKILTDSEFSMKQGIRLAKYYQQSIESGFGVTQESPAAWELVKLAHKAGLPSVERFLGKVQDASLDPAAMSWRDLKKFASANPRAGISLGQMSRVDVVMLRGKALAEDLAPKQ